MKNVDKTFNKFFFFFNQQFITWLAVEDRSSYFVTTYNRCTLHKEMEIDKRKGDEGDR